MKMVKSLLLGTAAGLVAMTGAQAADLPVKAKPVQYVKICSLYGAGFYYIPGTDTCLKVGGYIRVQVEAGANAGGIADLQSGTQGANVRLRNEYGYLARGLASFDARTQTEYGTLRSYFNIQVQNRDDVGTVDTLNTDAAFIQFAGFTAGISNSYFNFLSFAPYSYSNFRASGDNGAGGSPLIAYTAQFGNGLSASLSVENQNTRRGAIIDTGGVGSIAIGAIGAPGTDLGGFKAPEVVGNIRVDQAWGSAQVMAATHTVNTTYYTQTTVDSPGPSPTQGYAFGGGLLLNVPMTGPGDIVAVQAAWSKGAITYVAQGGGTWGKQQGGSSLGYGYTSDAVYGASPGDLELTTGWTINGLYQHNWNRQWKTDIYGGYVAVRYNDTANTLLCGDIGITVANGCNNDFSFWQVGSRTEWSPVANLAIGLDIMYTKLETASAGATTGAGLALTTTNVATTNISDQDVWSVFMRIQRNFYP